jgi:two-component system chemotaxis sensor kinase CheA
MAKDLYKYFRVEAQELLEQLHEGALALEKPGANAELVSRLLRCAHTLKGAARVVKQLGIAEAAHAFEELLAPHRALSAPWSEGQNDRLLAQLDSMSKMLAELDAPAPPSAATDAPAAPAAVEAARTLRADVGELDAVLDGVGETLAELASLRSLLEGEIEQARKLAEQCLRQLAAPRRHDPQRLERTKSLVEELSLSLRKLDGRVSGGVERAMRELGEVRSTAERLRLIPAHAMFTTLERAVRDAGRELGKAVRFEAHGGDIRLDGAVLEIVQSALFHVVRNAVTHGVEAADVRQSRGKPSAGLVKLEVKRRAGRIAFVCQDDGGGIDAAALRAALARNPQAGAREWTDSELLTRLMRGGVSSAEQVTPLAGRGVGLDVLREAAERLSGEVALHSEPGQGFRVELSVPVSAAALMGLVVESAGTTAALPLESVVQCLRLSAGAVSHGVDGESVLHEGKVIRFVPLSHSLRARESEHKAKAHSAVVVRAGQDERLAVGVDRVVGTRMVVLRRLPPLAAATPVVAGAALNALGRPELVLDPDGLLQSAAAAVARRPQPSAAARRLLVVDDSLTTRMLEQSILESAGYQVELAGSGEEGLAKARNYAYGVILVDVEMPGIDGFTFIEQLRADPQLRDTPAVLVSSRDEPEDLRRGKEVGASGYIVKGRFDQRELLQLLRGLLGR